MTEREWLEARLGKFTASNISLLLEGKRGSADLFGKKALSYIRKVAGECLTGGSEPVTSKEMEWGRQYEPLAFDEIRLLYPNAIYYGSFNPVFFPFGEYAGGSPDGEVDSKIIEIKCPYNTARHIEHATMTDEEFRDERDDYWTQMQFNMMCTGYASALFFSYDPRIFDTKKQLIGREFSIDIQFCEALEKRIGLAITELNKIIDNFLKQN